MRKRVVCTILPLLAGFSVHARVADLRIERLDTPAATAEQLHVQLDWPDGAAEGTLELTAKRLDFGDTGYRFNDLHWACTGRRTAPDDLSCEGIVRAAGLPAAKLRATWLQGRLDLRLAQAKSAIELRAPKPDAIAWQIELTRLPAAWLKPMLANLWPDGSLTDGRIDAQWALASSDDALTFGGPIAFASLGVDSSDGRIAAAALNAKGQLDVTLGSAATRIVGAFTLTGGELLFGSLYASLPATPIDLAWNMAGKGASTWSIEQARWSDPSALTLDATATLDTAAAAPLQHASVRFTVADLAIGAPRYFDSLLGGIGLTGLKTSGALKGNATLQNSKLDALDLAFTSVALEDAQQRFGVDALDGTLRLQPTATPTDSTLRWKAAHVHGIALGATTLALRSAAGGLALAQPASIPALGGTLTLPRFAWRPAADTTPSALDLALGLRNIDLRQLGRAFGWPEFEGTLTGDIPGVHYANEVIDLQGGLAMRVFDGDIGIDQLTLERPFGVAPTMTAAIAFSNLDLKPLTGAFGFGEITGRLNGAMRNLRLVDWTPVAFDATFETSTTAKDPRRISQRAVRDLTEVGGGGIAAGLQAQVLKVFQTFGYSRIGLSCTLANDVCRMGGLDGGDGGYTIVDGAGLPRVTVIGHQRTVNWPVLVSRLKAATDGQAPIID